jgi:tRNA-dihydrouridine synthase
MIGRGAFGNPWLIEEIVSLQQGLEMAPVSAVQRQEIARLHLDFFLETFGPRKAVLDMRKHLCRYARGLAGAAPFRSAVNQAGSLDELSVMIHEFFSAASSDAPCRA